MLANPKLAPPPPDRDGCAGGADPKFWVGRFFRSEIGLEVLRPSRRPRAPRRSPASAGRGVCALWVGGDAGAIRSPTGSYDVPHRGTASLRRARGRSSPTSPPCCRPSNPPRTWCSPQRLARSSWTSCRSCSPPRSRRSSRSSSRTGHPLRTCTARTASRCPCPWRQTRARQRCIRQRFRSARTRSTYK